MEMFSVRQCFNLGRKQWSGKAPGQEEGGHQRPGPEGRPRAVFAFMPELRICNREPEKTSSQVYSHCLTLVPLHRIKFKHVTRLSPSMPTSLTFRKRPGVGLPTLNVEKGV